MVSRLRFNHLHLLLRRFARHHDHPAHAELIGEHAEAGGIEGFGEGHGGFAPVFEGVEGAVGFGFVGDIQGEGEAFEAGLFAAAVGCHEGAAADPEEGVHDFVFEAWGHRTRRLRFRAVFVLHGEVHLGADGGAVEVEGFFTTSGKEEVGFDVGGGHGGDGSVVVRK